MLRIRLTRVGRVHKPIYRIIVCEKRQKRDGKVLEILGTYAPKEKEKIINLKRDRINYWIKMGAQPSETVKKIVNL